VAYELLNEYAQVARLSPRQLQRQMRRWRPWVLMLMAGWYELRWPGTPEAVVDRCIDGLRLFGIGASWGGYESLVTAAHMEQARSVTDWSARGPVVRLHIGLESPRDLIADLEQGLAALQQPA
jgi:hypothetical protein